MLLISKKEIKEVFTMKDSIEANNIAFRIFSEGKCQVPLRTHMANNSENGSFLIMPAYSEEINAASVKMVNVFPENSKVGQPTAPAQVFLMDGQTGMFKALINGTYLTQLRTGAASGVAFDLLGRKNARKGALIGTGGQAATQLEAMMTVRDLEKVKIYSPNQERLNAFVDRMSLELKDYNTKIIAAKSSDDAIEDADLIITVTSSKTPVFDGNKVKSGATISCIGSYQPHMQEMDPVILKKSSKIYFDSKEAVLSESGDILIPLAKGIISEADFTGDIGDVILGRIKGRESDEEIIVFKSVGIGVQDLVTAQKIYENAIINNVGTQYV